MIRSFLLISYRNIRDNKGASLLNILCLAIAMGTCVFIFNYVYYEMTFEDSHEKADELYRVEKHSLVDGALVEKNAYTTAQLGPDLVKAYEEVQRSTTLFPYSENGNAFYTIPRTGGSLRPLFFEQVYFAQPSFLELFNLDFLAGDAQSSLDEGNHLVISMSMAKEIFGAGAKPEIIIGTEFTATNLDLKLLVYTITGVFEDLPANTHLQFDALASMNPEVNPASLDNCYTYLHIPEGSWSQLNEALSQQISINKRDQTKEEFHTLRPLAKIHTAINVSNEPGVNTNALFLSFLSAMGFIILVLSCTNFVNNAIISSVERAKEIGMRRISGILPKQLFFNVMLESLLINTFAGLIGFGIFLVGFKSLITLADFNYPIGLDADTLMRSGILVMALVFIITLLSGVYPALLQLSINPLDAVRGKATILSSKQSSSGSKVIRVLVIFQLAMSIFFLSAMYVVQRQLDFERNVNKAPFRKNVTLKFGGLTGVNDIFNQEANGFLSGFRNNANTQIRQISNLYQGEIKTEQEIKSLFRIDIDTVGIDAPFVLRVADAYYWKEKSDQFLAGQNFSNSFGQDWEKAIINESALKAMKFETAENALDGQIGMFNGYLYVKGVIKNTTTDEPPLIYVTGYRYPVYFDLSFQTLGTGADNINRSIRTMQMRWERVFPWAYFIDRKHEDSSENEENLLKTFSLFTFIALSIACLGIFILSAFTAIKRTKEIGVRKVLGASALNILLMLIYDFVKLLAIASFVAIPLVIWGAGRWLTSYKEHVEISPLFVMVPVLLMLLIAALIILTQSWKSIVVNPMHALRAYN